MIKVIIFDCIGVLVDENGVNTELFDFIRGLKLRKTVLSNYSRAGYEAALPEEYRKLFDAEFLSGEMGMSKPDKGAFMFVLEQLNCEPDEVLFIDDLARNTDAAQELGLRVIMYQNVAQVRCDSAEMGVHSS